MKAVTYHQVQVFADPDHDLPAAVVTLGGWKFLDIRWAEDEALWESISLDQTERLAHGILEAVRVARQNQKDPRSNVEVRS